MKIADIFESQDDIDKKLYELIREYRHNDYDYDDAIRIVEYINSLNPPNLKAQELAAKYLHPSEWLYLTNIQQPLLNKLLTDKDVFEYINEFKDTAEYDNFVKNNFKNNQILINKWKSYIRGIIQN